MFKYLWIIISSIVFSIWVFINIKKFATDFRARYTSWKDFFSKNKAKIKLGVMVISTILLVIIIVLSFLAFYDGDSSFNLF